ncbi:nitrate- and nitrite sensing domain-containing protein [Aquabacterium sp. A3]|uniref:nitrate- and nitrite sensing domain-containing protein n=1 Tax=Aquabacterium sp. A3 TaxID=3132829 RepID=UPI003119B7F1
MPLSVSALVLRARQLEAEAIQRLAQRVELVDAIGQCMDALQRERGATSIYLASGGARFADERRAAIQEVQPLESQVRALMVPYLEPASGAQPKLLSLMAWVLLDLDALSSLRQRIDQQQLTAQDGIVAFSRLIGSQVELIFHLADAALHPEVSRPLVALVHLVQGKELAGQERALGGQLFASGQRQDDQQQRIVHLIEAQERSLSVFEEFADAPLAERWQHTQLTPGAAQIERLRRTLCSASARSGLDAAQAEPWFQATSQRIQAMWALEAELVQMLRQACAQQLQASQQQLQNAEDLLNQLKRNPPAHTHAVERFFNSPGAPLAPPVLSPVADAPDPAAVSSMVELLQAQSSRLASMEAELESAKRALNERKVIERAKGALMSRLGLSEEAAYRALQKAAMDHNKRLVDVAEATLALPDLAFAGQHRP